MKRWWILLLAALLLSSSCAHRVPQAQFPGVGVGTQLYASKKAVLPNGLTVIAVEKHKLPVFYAQLVVKTGAAYDPEDEFGLANLVASLLDKGAGARNASDIADEVDFTGGDLEISCGYRTTRVSAHVLVDHSRLGMALLSDIVIRPNFVSNELERERNKILSQIMRTREEPFGVVNDAFRDMVYQDSPHHRPVIGDAKSLAGIKRGDLVEFHRAYFLPNNSLLIIVADLSEEEMVELTQDYFGAWQKASLKLPDVPDPTPVEGKAVRLVDMDISQSYVAFGHLGPMRRHPDYNAVWVMNYILGGGGFVSRITKSIRMKQGLAYSAYSYYPGGTHTKGYFKAGLQTKLGSTSQALNLLLEEINRIRNEQVTDQELEDAKSFRAGSLPLMWETYAQVADLFFEREICGLKENFWLTDREETKLLTKEDIQRVARKYLDPDNFIIAIATKVDSLALEVKGITKDMIKVTNP